MMTQRFYKLHNKQINLCEIGSSHVVTGDLTYDVCVFTFFCVGLLHINRGVYSKINFIYYLFIIVLKFYTQSVFFSYSIYNYEHKNGSTFKQHKTHGTVFDL